MTINFQLIDSAVPSSSKGWARYGARTEKAPVVTSRTGNIWVSADHSGDVAAGEQIVLITEIMKIAGKGSSRRETIDRQTYTLIAEDGATCVPGSRDAESTINGVTTRYRVGGLVTVTGARLVSPVGQ